MNTVSYIYYPKQNSRNIGHGALVIDGCVCGFRSWDGFYAEPLGEKIERSKSGKGYPFFLFDITISPEQLALLREHKKESLGYSCSQDALIPLSRYGGYSVPFPFNVLPMIAALYLTAAKRLGSRRITKIKFFGNEDQNANLNKCLPGVLGETLFIGAMVSTAYFVLLAAFIHFSLWSRG